MPKIRCSECKEWYHEYTEKIAIAKNGGMCNRCFIKHLTQKIKAQDKIIANYKQKLKQINKLINEILED